MSKGNLEGNESPPEVHEASGEGSEKRLTRGKFIAGAGVAVAGLALGGVPAMAKGFTPQPRNKALKTGLPPGMIGGPVGFKTAERYQYPPNSEEGRAIVA